MARSHYTLLKNNEKGMIIAFFYCFNSIAIVARIMGRPWSTIKNFLTRLAKRGNQHKPSPLWPSTKTDKRRILRAVRHDRKITRK
jgi:hypothetical protein